MHCLIDFPDSPGALGVRLRHAFAHPKRVLMAWRHEQVRSLLREAEAEALAGCWCVGMVSYEAAPAFDQALRIHPCPQPGFPLAVIAIYESAAAWPAESGSPSMVADHNAHPYHPGDWRQDTTPERFASDFAAIKTAIREGAVYQINYTTRLRTEFSGNAQAYFEALRANQPGGYCAYLDWGTHAVLSASPELFFRREQGQLTTQPMKGTAPRGATDADDARNAQTLRSSEKERAENIMIVDLLRNDLGRVAVLGSVQVASLFDVEVLPTALQMTSTIHATPRPGATLDDIFGALFPCGSVTGAPKVSAMQTIAQLETSPRGAYCGAVGVIKPGGDAIFNVAIRTVTLEPVRPGSSLRQAVYGVGSGIEWDSTLAGEVFEIGVKSRLLRRAAQPFALLETLRLEQGNFWLLERHLERLRASARHFDFAFDIAEVRAALNSRAQKLQQARGPGPSLFRLRLLLARDGAIALEHAPLTATPLRTTGRMATQLADMPIDAADEFLYHKTTQRDLYDRHAPTDPACFDTLLWNADGELTEFTRGNLVLNLNGKLVTPPVACGLLPGTLRQELLATGKISEARLARAHLAQAKAIWFINSLRGWVGVEVIPARLAEAS